MLQPGGELRLRSLLINYGPMVPITEEDRWGYRYALQEKGFGEEALAEADRVNEIPGDIFDHGEERWDELAVVLDEVEVFPNAEHGILHYEGDDPSDRKIVGYAPGYLDLQVQWLRRQSGLEPE